MKISALLLRILEANNIAYVFGNPGTTETPFMEIISKHPNITYILALQEGSVIGIAAGYALSTGKLGLVNIHTYPGLANAMCNLYSAMKAHIPLLVTAGQQDRRHLSLHPTLSGPLTALADTATKYSEQVNFEIDFGLQLQRAINISVKPPQGPSFLAFPMDVLNSEIDEPHELQPMTHIQPSGLVPADFEACITQFSHHWKNTLILVDQNGLSAHQEIEELATYLAADIYSSPFPNCIPIDTNHPNYCGGFPSFASKQREVMASYDVILLIGNGLGYFLYDAPNAIPPHSQLVHINDSYDQIGTMISSQFAFTGHLPKSIAAFHAAIKNHPEITAPTLKPAANPVPEDSEETALSLPVIIREVVSVISPNTPIIIEAGSFEAEIKNKLKRPAGTLYTAPKGGGLGWAMPLSVGIALGTDQPTICFVGDGGANYGIHSIYTALQQKLTVVFICLNNHAYTVLKQLWKYQFPHAQDQDMNVMDLTPPVNLSEIAKGYGAITYQPKDAIALQQHLQSALKTSGPSFIDIAYQGPDHLQV